MKWIAYYILPLLVGLIVSCSPSHKSPTTASHVDIQKYMGTWHEIASFPNNFQKGCRCTSAHYILKGNKILVLNRCRKNSNRHFTVARGKAWPVNKNDNSKLKVQFFWPFRGDYWILYLTPDYHDVLIGSPNRRYLWILSRQKTMSDNQYKKMVSIAKEKGYDVRQLRKTIQNCHDQSTTMNNP